MEEEGGGGVSGAGSGRIENCARVEEVRRAMVGGGKGGPQAVVLESEAIAVFVWE